MINRFRFPIILTCALVAGALLLGLPLIGQSQQQPDDGISTAQVKSILQQIGVTVQESSPSQGQTLLTAMWDHEHFHYETFVSVSRGKWVWFLSPLQGIPNPDKIPHNVLLQLLHQNDQNGGWYFSWDPTQKRFYLNHLFYYSEFTPENMKASIVQYQNILAKTLPYWDPKQWGNSSAAPAPTSNPELAPSITPQ